MNGVFHGMPGLLEGMFQGQRPREVLSSLRKATSFIIPLLMIVFYFFKSRIREPLNPSTDADSSTDTIFLFIFCLIGGRGLGCEGE